MRDARGEGADPGMSRSDMALIGQALRQDWDIPPEVREKILARLTGYVVEVDGDGPPATPSPRTVIAAARTIAAFCRLSLDQQRLDAKQPPAAAGDDVREVLLSEAYALCLEKRRPPGLPDPP